MARRVFFSFHYQVDIFRVNQVRNAHVVEGAAAAGFQDASLWEESKRKGNDAVKRLIDAGLNGTTVTVVLIGSDTSKRKFVGYEIQQSIARGNGLLGIYIHNLKDPRTGTAPRGAVPAGLLAASAPVYDWDPSRFGEWVEAAARKVGR